MRTARTLTGGGDCKRQKKKMTQTPQSYGQKYILYELSTIFDPLNKSKIWKKIWIKKKFELRKMWIKKIWIKKIWIKKNLN